MKKKKKGCSGKDLQKKGFKSGMKERVGDEKLIIISIAVVAVHHRLIDKKQTKIIYNKHQNTIDMQDYQAYVAYKINS